MGRQAQIKHERADAGESTYVAVDARCRSSRQVLEQVRSNAMLRQLLLLFLVRVRAAHFRLAAEPLQLQNHSLLCCSSPPLIGCCSTPLVTSQFSHSNGRMTTVQVPQGRPEVVVGGALNFR